MRTSHHDPLVITPIVQRRDQQKIRLDRVLVNTGASVDVLYWNAFDQLGFCKADLGPCGSLVTRFVQGEVPVLGTIVLQVTLGSHAKATTIEVKFTVVAFSFGYNAILGRVALHAFGAVTSSLHQCLKFSSEAGVCTVKGSKIMTGLTTACEKDNLPHTAQEERPKPSPASTIVPVELAGRTVQIGAKTPPENVGGDNTTTLKNEYLFAKDLGDLKGGVKNGGRTQTGCATGHTTGQAKDETAPSREE